MRIIIVGGVGARATATFFQHCLNAVTELVHPQVDSDFPDFIVTSYSIPQGAANGKFTGKEVEDHVNQAFELAKVTPDDIVAFPCNSAQDLLPDLPYRVINNIEATLSQVMKPNIVVFASEGCVENKGWESTGASVTYPPTEVQNEVTALIQAGLTGVPIGPIAPALEEYMVSLTHDTSLILGCTELSDFKKILEPYTQAQVIDSSESIAQATVNLWLETKAN